MLVFSLDNTNLLKVFERGKMICLYLHAFNAILFMVVMLFHLNIFLCTSMCLKKSMKCNWECLISFLEMVYMFLFKLLAVKQDDVLFNI